MANGMIGNWLLYAAPLGAVADTVPHPESKIPIKKVGANFVQLRELMFFMSLPYCDDALAELKGVLFWRSVK
ncbi:hypothetical protein PPUN109347_36830 [Pseudomonas putida]|nr:hypothetical protein PPUN109347_36830 [Pseudomonas putida]